MNEKLNYYTIWYIPYPGWGMWIENKIMTKSELEKFKKEKEILKIIKHRKLPFTPDCQECR